MIKVVFSPEDVGAETVRKRCGALVESAGVRMACMTALELEDEVLEAC